jgi:exopolyphosphatase/guanosine-5'-triphosphate,3'-diphosphate pyrophosphatase
MQEYETLAAIDLGSNSFHLQVGRVDGEQLFYLDSHKESVRLAGGLTADKTLDAAAQDRALACLSRFGERLKGMPPGAVRAVGTSALRQARDAAEFIERAREALGFDIDIVAGREEARLIYLGVSHSLPHTPESRLVVDIGGGSTECIIGTGYEAKDRESLRMGCVVFSNRFFPDGQLDKAAIKAAVTAARIEVQPVAHTFRHGLWHEAVGSSGTAKAMGEILFQNGLSDGHVTADGLKWLREQIGRAGSIECLELAGLKTDRKPVIAGGVAIMSGVFRELEIQEMAVAQGAMREGILWDLLGRVHDHDIRDVSVRQFMRRYHVDGKQARRVERLAVRLYMQLMQGAPDDSSETVHRLMWAARLHEIGISIAHSGFHKHGAYILENADMPGFSRREQGRLASLVRAARGGLDKLGLAPDYPDWSLLLCLRLAVLFNISRADRAMPNARLGCEGGECVLKLPCGWGDANPLTRIALDQELKAWRSLSARVRLASISEVD